MFGLIDTTYIDWPANLDAAYLRGLQTRSGIAFAELAGRLDRALGSVNNGFDSLLASLLAPPTTSVTAVGGTIGSMRAEWKSEYTVARPQYVEAAATALAIDELEIALGFTEDGLMEISLDNFDLQLRALASALELAARRATLVRLFSQAEVPVARGTAMTSPGFAGSGTAGNVFQGTYPDGTALPGSYSLYYRDTAANRVANLRTARDELKRWQPGPYDLIGSTAYVSALITAAGAAFVYAGSALIRPAIGTAEALVDPTAYLGVFDGDVRVRLPLPDFAADNAALYKSGGDLAAGNPLVWRYDPMRGPDAYVRSRELFPLAESVAMWKFGANVQNRTAAALICIAASGGYVAPPITF
jgi:hypothetical protein